MKTLFFRIIISCSILFCSNLKAFEMNPRIGYVFGATGQLLGLSAIRAGYLDFEAGKLNINCAGFVKMFRSSSYSYAGLGLAATARMGIGPFVALGLELPVFQFFWLRTELNASYHHTAETHGEWILGGTFAL